MAVVRDTGQIPSADRWPDHVRRAAAMEIHAVSDHGAPKRRLAAAAALVLFGPVFAALAGATADATTQRKQNLTQLIAESQSILAGRVERVTDGIDERGMPYTEITVAVSSAAKGQVHDGSRYRFRQFGLQKPQKMPNGKEMLALSPEGFPEWSVGEQVVAFLFEPASRTGFQTTVGLAQGKLRMKEGRVSNEFNNEGLFDNVQIESGLLSASERTMLASKGPVDAATLLGLVSRAVRENWIVTGEMR
jgi:hypothetical protein